MQEWPLTREESTHKRLLNIMDKQVSYIPIIFVEKNG